TLTILNLGYNDIGDVAAQHLGDGLLYNRTLTTLNLRTNKIGDVTARHLADALRYNTVIVALALAILCLYLHFFHLDTHHSRTPI
ncbi:unnamed protein product, partial [Adineta steineri]